MKDKEKIFLGCLAGCAAGDSIGLPYEGVDPRRIRKMTRSPLKQSLFFGRGMVSDDTDHTVFVAQSLILHPLDAELFARSLAHRLRLWLLCIPAGIGFATLRGILKLWVGVSPEKSGVFSAGNGAAMRSALIGVFHSRDAALRERFTRAATLLTHRDPKAFYGALAVAEVAAFVTENQRKPSLQELEELVKKCGEGKEWEEVVSKISSACRSEKLEDSLVPAGVSRGVSGYIYHTLPAALTAWYLGFGDFRKTIESAVFLGGDTDTVAAIAGALAGISCGEDGIPKNWLERLTDFPHGKKLFSRLAFLLGQCEKKEERKNESATRFSGFLFFRGLVFTTIVLGHGFRRLLPPY